MPWSRARPIRIACCRKYRRCSSASSTSATSRYSSNATAGAPASPSISDRYRLALTTNPVPWSALGDRLDTLAMVLGAHQPILLDEFDIGLRANRFHQAAARRAPGRDDRQWRVLGDFGGQLGGFVTQLLGLHQHVGKAPRVGLFSADTAAGEEHQVGPLHSD